jgi:predicted RND superfamily exporter protein
LTGVFAARTEINIFTQIGFVVLVGLASKNAILIVEFAKRKKEAGLPRREAALQACRLRLRPILMTSFAFILGVVPLILGRGAGHEMRQSLGIAVFSGMLGVTLFGIFLTPVFFNVIEWAIDHGIFSSPLLKRLNAVSLKVVAFPAKLVREAVNTIGRRLPQQLPSRAASPLIRDGAVKNGITKNGAANGAEGHKQADALSSSNEIAKGES